MKNSFILSRLAACGKCLQNWFINSVYCKIWMKIMSFFGTFFSQSFADYVFCGKRETDYAKNSFIVSLVLKIFDLFDSIFGKPIRFLKRKYGESAIGRAIDRFFEKKAFIPLRYYGIFVFAYGCISMAADSAENGFVSNRFIAITVLGLVLSISSASLSVIVNNEFFIKKFKLQPFKKAYTVELNTHNAVATALISGAVFGAMGFVPLLQFAVLGLAALVVLFYHPGALCFLTVGLLPFMPTMAVVGMMLFSMFLCFVSYLSKNDKSFRVDGFDIAVAVLVFMNVYGVAISQKPVASSKIAAVYIVFIAFFYVLRRFLASRKSFFATLDFFIVSATAVAGYGIIEQLFGLSKTTWQDEEMFEEIAGRACSTFENPNVLGEFLLLTIPLTAARLFDCKSFKNKLLYAASGVMQVLCMVFTYSRGCWLGIMFAMVIFLAFCGKKLFTFMTVGVFALPFVVPQSIIDRLLSIGNTADTSTAYRVFIWEGTCRMLKDTWLYGIGLGTEAFNCIYPRYALGAITAPHPHNLYLLILSETGLIGAIAVGAVLMMYFRTTGRICRVNPSLRVYAVSFGAAMGGYLLQGMFDNVWYNYRIYALFVIILAFAAALRDIAEVEKQ